MVRKRWIKFEELTETDCRFPKGETQFRFCGDEKERGSYCKFHADICSSGKPDRTYKMHKPDEKKEAA